MAIEKIEANIKGMHCAACSTRIERVVNNVDGVSDCSVNLATEKAKITYDPSTVTTTAIAEAIAGLGFSAEIVTAETDETDSGREGAVRLQSMKNRLLPAFVLALLIMWLSMAGMVGMTLPAPLHPEHSPLSHAVYHIHSVQPVPCESERS